MGHLLQFSADAGVARANDSDSDSDIGRDRARRRRLDCEQDPTFSQSTVVQELAVERQGKRQQLSPSAKVLSVGTAPGC